jgi:multidrug resistance protein MdtO
MWLVFDQLWGAPTAVEMRRTFTGGLRLLALLAQEPLSSNLRAGIERTYSLRDTINKSFSKVRDLADGVVFEFGACRQEHLALRSRMIRWQPQLRLLFLTRISLLKYRLQLPGFELPESLRLAQREFDEVLAKTLNGMADHMEDKAHGGLENLESALARLEEAVRNFRSYEAQEILAARLQTFLLLSRRIEGLAVSLDKEILAPISDV